MARAFPGERMLTHVDGQQVNFADLGSRCVNAAICGFLIDGTAPATDVTCPILGRH